jgi:predicted nucleotidyltransferase
MNALTHEWVINRENHATEAEKERHVIDLVEQKRSGIAEHCRRLNVRRLDVFGSAARGDFDPEKSDIDFLVEFNDHHKPGIANRYFDLEKSLMALFDRKVDLVVWRHFDNPYFRTSVEESKEPVYET